MHKFKKILLLAETGPATHLLDRAAGLAQSNGADLSVVDVLELLPPEMCRLVLASEPEDLIELAAEQRLAQLELLVEPKRQQGCKISTRVVVGTRSLEVIREVLREGYDLVMMAAEGSCERGEALFGSAALQLMRKCPCPVWVIKPNQERCHARALVAVDPLSSDEIHQSLNVRIMELAVLLARIERSELHVVHAWQPQIDREPPGVRERLAQECARVHEDALHKLVASISTNDVRHRIHLVRGDAPEIITALAWSIRADVIIMGTVCRSGIASLWIGSTAERVLRRVNCSVLAVKPDGFVSPVTVDMKDEVQNPE